MNVPDTFFIWTSATIEIKRRATTVIKVTMATTPPDASATPATNRPPEELSLSHAMKAADSIRRQFAQASENSDSTTMKEKEALTHTVPPGLLQGVGAFALAGVALLPVRRLVLGHPSINTHQAFRNFVDLTVSVGHALAAAQVGLIGGSLYGGKTYLDEFSKASASIESTPFMDAVCEDLQSNVLPASFRRPDALDTGSFDPRIQTMISLQRVLDKCQRRLEYRD